VLRVDQQQRWRRGELVPVEAYFGRYPVLLGEADHALDLVYEEFLLREQRGEGPRLEEYGRRFPQLAEALRLQLEVYRAVLAGGSGGPAQVAGYEVLEELGRGGMGVVYKARQVGLNRLAALRMILSGAHAGAEESARFRFEAEAMARLQHPNIVQICEVGEQGRRPFFAMEFVAGGSLADRLGGAPLQPAEAAALVETLARAVQHTHERGVLHRDLKPSNVLLDADGAPKATDFGLAKRLGPGPANAAAPTLTRTGMVVGTPSYMAPEQAGGVVKQVGPPADVYGLGAILYECLTGRPPFRADDSFHTLQQVLTEEPAPPRRLQPGVPRDLETVCLKCLQKNPKRRYAGARALAEDLRRLVEGRPVAARPVGAAARACKWARRRPAAAAVLAGALAALALLGAGGWYADHQRRQAEPSSPNFHLSAVSSVPSVTRTASTASATAASSRASVHPVWWSTRTVTYSSVPLK
jgi:hypothetical protein